MTKAELINQISLASGFDKKTVGVIVETFMDKVKKNVSEGENVFLRGFGSFVSKTRKAKVARNIWKDLSIAVPSHKIPAFKPAAEFSAEVRKLG